MNFSQNILDFLKEPNFMVIGTIRKDGSPQMTIVWFEYENGVFTTGSKERVNSYNSFSPGEPVETLPQKAATFQISTTAERVKYKNVSRDPRVTMLIYDRGNPYRYLQIQGKVSDITKQGAHDFIDKLSGRYTGNAKYKRDPDRKEDRVIISIEPLRHNSVGFA